MPEKETAPAKSGEEVVSEKEEATASNASANAETAEVVTEESEEQAEARKVEEAVQAKKEKKRKRKELYTAKEEAQTERARADQAERELQALKTSSKPQGRPDRDDFENEEDYEDALFDFRMDKKDSTTAKESQKASQAKVEQDNRAKYNSGVADAEEKYEDFHEVAGDAGDCITSAFLANQIKASDKAHDIVYYLGKNPDEARRISKLSEFAQAKELGKLEAQLDKEITQNNVTQANDPGKEIKGAGVGAVAGKQETTAEYIARTNAEEEARWAAGE